MPLPLINSRVSARIVQWENLGYDASRVTRGSKSETNVEREWNAAKYKIHNMLFYLLNTGVSRKVQVLSSAPILLYIS
jgi:hypothetical protein